jgi:hypothetical protein
VKNTRTSEKFHKFSVLPESLLTVSVLAPNERISVSSQNIIRANVKSSQSKGITYQWSLILGSLSVSSFAKNLQNLVIPANSLISGDYSFKLTVSLDSLSSSVTVSFKANGFPICDNSLTVSPSLSSFTKSQKVNFSLLNCLDGDNLDYPLSFKFSIRKLNGKYSLLLVQNDGNFNDLKFPVGVNGVKIEVCDTLNDCIERSTSFSITGQSRNLKLSHEMMDYLENKNFMNGLQAIVFALLNPVNDEELLDLLWDDLVEYVSLETWTKVVAYEVTSTLLLFVDEPQQVSLALPRISKYCKFLKQTIEKINFLPRDSLKYFKDFIDRVNYIDRSESSIILTFDIIASYAEIDFFPGNLFEFSTKNITFYQTEKLFIDIKKIQLGQTVTELKNPGFTEDSIIKVKSGIFTSGKYSEVVYLEVSSDKKFLDSEIQNTQLQFMNNEGACVITTAYTLLKPDEVTFHNILPNLHKSQGNLLNVSNGFAIFEVSQGGVFTLSSNKSSEMSTFHLKHNFLLVMTLTALSFVVIFLVRLYSKDSRVENESSETQRNSNLGEKVDVSNITEFSYVENERTQEKPQSKHLFLRVFSLGFDSGRCTSVLMLASMIDAQVLVQTVLLTQTDFGLIISGVLSSFIVFPLMFLVSFLLENKMKRRDFYWSGIGICLACIGSSVVVTFVLDETHLWLVAFICGIATEVGVSQNLLSLLRRKIGLIA